MSKTYWIVINPGKGSRLECLRCGMHYAPALPAPAAIVLAILSAFNKTHRRCKPHPDGDVCLHCSGRGHESLKCDSLTRKQTPHGWLRGTDTGISSMTIWCVMMGDDHFTAVDCSPSNPWDPDDFGRCYRLLKLFPEWRARISEMAKVKGWKGLAEHWDELERLYDEELPTGMAPRLYQRIQELTR